MSVRPSLLDDLHVGQSLLDRRLDHSSVSHLTRLRTLALRRIFLKLAENSAYDTLREICHHAQVSVSNDMLRAAIKDTIVPAYNSGWLSQVETLAQLQDWLARRAAHAFADKYFGRLDIQQYLRLHCLSQALDDKKITTRFMLDRCPEAAYIMPELFDDMQLDAWRQGAAEVRQLSGQLEEEHGLDLWLMWVKKSKPPAASSVELVPWKNVDTRNLSCAWRAF